MTLTVCGAGSNICRFKSKRDRHFSDVLLIKTGRLHNLREKQVKKTIMRTLFLLPLFVALISIEWGETAKILAVFPFAGKSHNIFVRSITDDLASRGHDVTVYTILPSGKNTKNLKEIQLKNKFDDFLKEFNFNTLRSFGAIPVLGLPGLSFMGIKIANLSLNDPVMAGLIRSNEKFDLVLLETHFGQEALVALGHKFQAPVVSLNPTTTSYIIDEYIGNPFGTAYLPTFEVPYTDKMNFWQRVHNAVRTLICHLTNYLYYLPNQDKLMRHYFKYPGSENLPPISDMLQDISLVVVNSQFSVDYPRPWLPSVVDVGGAHISPNRKPLPKDLQTFLDEATYGFIYFSFGSVVPSEQLPEEMKQAFINAFRRLPQRVLWKLPVDSFPGLPDNVKISKWLPQHDVLAHPKCLAFITHGGILSQIEAVYFGVPLIGVPFFADQYLNVNRAVARGFAIHLDQYNITEESVYWAIHEVATNAMYSKNAKKYSEILLDNPLSPRDKAAYWIEYVLRHKGAPHLRSEGRKLPYYKYLLLDVTSFIVLTLVLAIMIVYKIFSVICKKIFCRKKESKKVASKKKKN